MKIEILKESECCDFVEVIDLYNTDEKALNGYQVDFDIKATNKNNETKLFHIVFQSKERNNGLEAYNGYEMSTATDYGCDADESQEFSNFMDYEEGIFDELFDRAKDLSKSQLESMI